MDSSLQAVAAGFRKLIPDSRRLLLLSSIVGAFFLFFLLVHKPVTVPVTHPGGDKGRPSELPRQPDGLSSGVDFEPEQRLMTLPASPLPKAMGGNDFLSTSREPRMAYSAELAVETKEFTRSRSRLEEILERHRGYVAKMRMVGQATGSELSATLRIPSSEYQSALSDFKSIGRLARDEESADEITQQHGELEARLLNAKNTERRLEQLLKDYEGKNDELAPIERQLAVLRQQVQSLEAERNVFESRAVFSSIFFTMREDLTTPTESLSAQLRSAAGSGLADALHTLSSIFLFVVGYGPSMLLWIGILFLPLRFLWRRSRTSLLREAS